MTDLPVLYACPCCGYLVFTDVPGSYDICPVCLWEDDGVQLRFPTLSGGANEVSLLKAQANFADVGVSDPELRDYASPLKVEELSALKRDEKWRRIEPGRDIFDDFETATIAINDNVSARFDIFRFYYWL